MPTDLPTITLRFWGIREQEREVKEDLAIAEQNISRELYQTAVEDLGFQELEQNVTNASKTAAINREMLLGLDGNSTAAFKVADKGLHEEELLQRKVGDFVSGLRQFNSSLSDIKSQVRGLENMTARYLGKIPVSGIKKQMDTTVVQMKSMRTGLKNKAVLDAIISNRLKAAFKRQVNYLHSVQKEMLEAKANASNASTV